MNTKAIAVYLDDSDRMEEELSWLYKTWILYSLEKEYDLVVYYNPPAEHRLNKFDGIKAFPMPYIRLALQYRFLNSHYFCKPEYREPLMKYDYLMKTDCDVFLTKSMKGYNPCKLLVGEGGYYDTSDAIKSQFIRDISKIYGMRDYRMVGVGASFFGDSGLVTRITSSQADMTEIILSTYFKDSDIHQPSGFHKGISSMIAGELVVNHCTANQHVILYALDSKCWKSAKLGSDVLHIHAWHTKEEWSKHKFFDGKYKDWKVDMSDAFDNAGNYCHWIATTPLETIKKLRHIFR